MERVERDPFGHLDDDLFGRFGALIERATGISFDDKKREILRLHLKERARETGASDFYEYLRVLESPTGTDELVKLANKVVVHQTEFFRNRPQFEALEQVVLPELLSAVGRPGRTLKVWSAGCSSGEEPYSIAMVIARCLGAELPLWSVEVLGTDISEPILEKAAAATYSPKAARTVPEPYKSAYLKQRSDGAFEVAPEIRDLVSFKPHNLVLEDPPPELSPGAQLVFCRNVTIYFSRESLARAIANIFSALAPGGYLFLGHSESLLGIDHSFELVDLAATFAYRKPRPVSLLRAPQRPPARIEPKGPGPSRAAPSGAAAGILGAGGGAPPLRRAGRDDFARPGGYSRPGTSGLPEGLTGAEAYSAATQVPTGEDHARIKEAVAEAQGLLEKGQPHEARELVERALSRHPTEAALHFLHGSALQVLGERESAAAAFGKALYCDQRFSLAFFYRGALHEECGNREAAARDYAAAMRLLEEDPPGRWDPYLESMDHLQLVEVCREKLKRLQEAVER